MNMTPTALRPAAQIPTSRSLFADPPRQKSTVQLRRYDILGLNRTGQIVERRQAAPALPLFESAFCAFARGSTVETEDGPMAIEDLLPGDKLITRDNGPQPLVWIGRTLVQPGQPMGDKKPLKLTRIMTDSFGMARPSQCVITGPSARLLYTPHHLRGTASDGMLTPVSEFTDGDTVIETTPPTPVELFHLYLPQHSIIRVGGLEFESYHPGPNATRTSSHQMRDLFLSLFPSVDYMSSFGALAHPRTDGGHLSAVGA